MKGRFIIEDKIYCNSLAKQTGFPQLMLESQIHAIYLIRSYLNIFFQEILAYAKSKNVFIAESKRLIVISIFLFVFTGNIFPQIGFSTGVIGVDESEYGRIRIHVPKVDSFRQIDRISLLLAIDSGSVYNYMLNAEPYFYSYPFVDYHSNRSDMEIVHTYQMIKDFFPHFTVTHNIYGWRKSYFVIVKISIENNLGRDVLANIGFEIIPQIGSEFGGEKIKIAKTTKTILINKNIFLGIRYCNPKNVLFPNISEWDYNYFRDETLIYKWMTNKIADTTYTASEKGSIITACVQPALIPANDIVSTYFYVACSTNESDLNNVLRLADKEFNILTSVKDEIILPDKICLEQNYPNPFNPATKIKFSIPNVETPYMASLQVTLKVYDILGNEVATLINEEKNPGNYEVDFHTGDLPSGIYFYRLKAGDRSLTKKMTLMK